MTEALVDVAEQRPREVDHAIMHISCLLGLVYYSSRQVQWLLGWGILAAALAYVHWIMLNANVVDT